MGWVYGLLHQKHLSHSTIVGFKGLMCYLITKLSNVINLSRNRFTDFFLLIHNCTTFNNNEWDDNSCGIKFHFLCTLFNLLSFLLLLSSETQMSELENSSTFFCVQILLFFLNPENYLNEALKQVHFCVCVQDYHLLLQYIKFMK